MTPEVLPREWSWRVLQDIGKIVTGNTPLTSEPALWGGSIPFVTPTDLGHSAVVSSTGRTLSNEGAARARLLPPRSVLVTCIASIGKNALASTSCCTNQQINAVVCNESAWPEYIYYGLCYRTAELQRLAGATAVSIVSKGKFEQFGLPLPPLPEQRKIAAILSSVDEAIEGTQAVIDQLQVVKKAMMADLLTRGIPGRHKKFKQTEIGEVSVEWEVCSIDSLGTDAESTVRSGPFGSSMKTKDFVRSGVPVLTIQSLGHGELLREGLFYVGDEKARELAEYKVRPNDVVFSRVADIGRCAAISEDEAGWLISPNLSRIRLDPEKADARFLMYLITTAPSVLRQVEMVAGNAGRPVISSSTLRELRLPVPALPEQQAISAAGQELEHRLGVERQFLSQLQGTKSALMSVLLTGEVRVRVDEEVAA